MSDHPFLFNEDDLRRIKMSIGEVEKLTSGEICVSVLPSCDKDLKNNKDLSERVYNQALREFSLRGLENTRERTGVLVLLVIEERRFQILADSGINKRINQAEWDFLSAGASNEFREGRFTDGVIFIIEKIGEKLAEFFPRRPDDVNELPDDVFLGGGK